MSRAPVRGCRVGRVGVVHRCRAYRSRCARHRSPLRV